MISVIICSRGPEYRKVVTESIAATIGVPYEIVVVDNSTNKYGICAAYNEGAARSKYGLLCFAHEDITFSTDGWGNIIGQILRDSTIGAVGATGGKWLPKAPGTWWSCGPSYLHTNLWDEDRVSGGSQQTYLNPENQLLTDVAAVDGLWICTRKEVWKKYPFDEQTFTGFHFYDVDFCANLYPHFRVCVTFEIDITHFSRGSYNDSWMLDADRFYCKHAGHLPLHLPAISEQEVHNKEHDICKGFLLQLIKRKLPAQIGYKYLARCARLRPFSRDTLWLIRHYVHYAAFS